MKEKFVICFTLLSSACIDIHIPGQASATGQGSSSWDVEYMESEGSSSDTGEGSEGGSEGGSAGSGTTGGAEETSTSDATGGTSSDTTATSGTSTGGGGGSGPQTTGMTNASTTEEEDDSTTDDANPSKCGDGIVNPGEQCDDGNDDNTDGCLDTCLLANTVFTTSMVFKTDLAAAYNLTDIPLGSSGYEKAKALCNFFAQEAELEGVFEPWLSESDPLVNPDSKMAECGDWEGAFVLPSGELVRDDGWEHGLTVVGNNPNTWLYSPLDEDEYGNKIEDENGYVLTGTYENATPVFFQTCNSWNTTWGEYGARVGNLHAVDRNWSSHKSMNCAETEGRLYCIQSWC